MVPEARAKELSFFYSKGVWVKRPHSMARAKTRRPPISVRWVDVSKGDELNLKYRSRFVARQLKATDKSNATYFAPTPPLDLLRSILMMASSNIGNWRTCRDKFFAGRTQIPILDIGRAYFNANTYTGQHTYVALLPEDPDSGVLCAELLRRMYGTRAAADGWHEEYSNTLVSVLGFTQGVSSPCVFRNEREA
jgi:hypothetical protein